MDRGRLLQDTSITSFKTGCPIGILAMVHYLLFFTAHLGPGHRISLEQPKQMPRIGRFDTWIYSHHRKISDSIPKLETFTWSHGSNLHADRKQQFW